MKEKVLELLQIMGESDSKSLSYKAEKELIKILEEVIYKKCTLEDRLGAYEMDYPESIYNVCLEGKCKDLPSIIYCNDYEFEFETSWFDINWKDYFNKLVKRKIEYLKTTIKMAEDELANFNERLNHFKNLKFIDINF